MRKANSIKLITISTAVFFLFIFSTSFSKRFIENQNDQPVNLSSKLNELFPQLRDKSFESLGEGVNFSKLTFNEQTIIFHAQKPRLGNPFNQASFSALENELKKISREQPKLKTIVFLGDLHRGLDIKEIIGAIDPDDINFLANHFDSPKKEEPIDPKVKSRLKKSLTVFKNLGDGMYKVLHALNELHEKGVQSIAISQSATAGGAVLFSAANYCVGIGENSIYYLPEADFDIEVSILWPFLKQKNISQNTTKAYLLGRLFNANEALQTGILDQLIDQSDAQKTLTQLIKKSNQGVLVRKKENRSHPDFSLANLSATQSVKERTQNFLNHVERKNFSTQKALDLSRTQALSAFNEDTVILFAQFLHKSDRLRQFAN